MTTDPNVPDDAQPPAARQLPQQAGVAPSGPGGALFTEPVLVVGLKAEPVEQVGEIEPANEYQVMDQHGTGIGSVTEAVRSTLKKALRFGSGLDRFLTHRLEIRDAAGQPQLLLSRPAKLRRPQVTVTRPDGTPVGEIVQQEEAEGIDFAILTPDYQLIGAIRAENRQAWNFSVVDDYDREVARITKTWEGLARTPFTAADHCALEIHHQLSEPLLSLVVAAALTVDTALKQDDSAVD
ncbi:phospholipid scramblase-related protein [Streptomyces sp. NPDC002499]